MRSSLSFPTGHLGPSLRRWRLLNRVKQSALADEIGVSQATVSRWEAGALVPDAREEAHLVRLLAARPTSAADRAVLCLVTTSSLRMHLICDLTHRLLAVSPARAREWRVGAADLMGSSLWRFASDDIKAAEAALAERGWYEAVAPDVTIVTERAEHPELTIRAGSIHYARIPLSDGRFVRLVQDGVRTGRA